MGHYEGDTLVAESSGLSANFLRNLIPHSEDLRIVERYSHEVPNADGSSRTRIVEFDRVWFLSLTREDGSELVRPALDRRNALEEQRRQRVRERLQSE